MQKSSRFAEISIKVVGGILFYVQPLYAYNSDSEATKLSSHPVCTSQMCEAVDLEIISNEFIKHAVVRQNTLALQSTVSVYDAICCIFLQWNRLRH